MSTAKDKYFYFFSTALSKTFMRQLHNINDHVVQQMGHLKQKKRCSCHFYADISPWSIFRYSNQSRAFLPPASAIEVIESVLSVFMCVCL